MWTIEKTFLFLAITFVFTQLNIFSHYVSDTLRFHLIICEEILRSHCNTLIYFSKIAQLTSIFFLVSAIPTCIVSYLNFTYNN